MWPRPRRGKAAQTGAICETTAKDSSAFHPYQTDGECNANAAIRAVLHGLGGHFGLEVLVASSYCH